MIQALTQRLREPAELRPATQQRAEQGDAACDLSICFSAVDLFPVQIEARSGSWGDGGVEGGWGGGRNKTKVTAKLTASTDGAQNVIGKC